MNLDIESGEGRLSARLTAWDERALGFTTAEVTLLQIEDASQATALLAELEHWCATQSVHYLFGRIDATHAPAKAALLQHGYAFVETSLTVSRSGFANLPPVPRGMLPTLRAATNDDIATLRDIAATDFVHGRFLEDPAIDPQRAALRTANWIEDLVKGELAYVAESRGRTIGFHAERVAADNGNCDLLLTGATGPIRCWRYRCGSLRWSRSPHVASRSARPSFPQPTRASSTSMPASASISTAPCLGSGNFYE